MTWALCVGCGGLKFVVWRACRLCHTESSGDMNMDLAFSSHSLPVPLLHTLGKAMKAICEACTDKRERRFAFLKFVSDDFPVIGTIRLPPDLEAKIPALSESIDLPSNEEREKARQMLERR
jgi:hypothetical protein